MSRRSLSLSITGEFLANAKRHFQEDPYVIRYYQSFAGAHDVLTSSNNSQEAAQFLQPHTTKRSKRYYLDNHTFRSASTFPLWGQIYMELVCDIYFAVLKDGWWVVDQYIRNDSLERR